MLYNILNMIILTLKNQSHLTVYVGVKALCVCWLVSLHYRQIVKPGMAVHPHSLIADPHQPVPGQPKMVDRNQIKLKVMQYKLITISSTPQFIETAKYTILQTYALSFAVRYLQFLRNKPLKIGHVDWNMNELICMLFGTCRRVDWNMKLFAMLNGT